ncbi:MAG: glycosyltransferase 87 family protein [Cyanobacteria bacterium]|nr:glycosyltransferase 87 family protein [Cyanobacteriota bacterium]
MLKKFTSNKKLFLLLILFGIILRIVLAFNSFGSNDIFTWYNFANKLNKYGLGYLYKNDPNFNHPPIMGYYAGIILWLSKVTGIKFAFIFKIPTIFSDFLITALLLKILKKNKDKLVWKKAANYSLSIIAILISAYHGNTDSFIAFFLLLSAYLIENNNPFFAGLSLAISINVKIIPIILIPLLLTYYKNKKNDLYRFVYGLSLGAIPLLTVIFLYPKSFFNNVVMYNSNVENWGINLFLLDAFKTSNFALIAFKLFHFYLNYGKYFILIFIIYLSLINFNKNKWNPYELCFIGMAVFLIFTPGFGIQYLVYVAALLFVINYNWGLIYSFLSGIFAALIYYSFWDKNYPLQSIFYSTYLPPTQLFGLIVWIFLFYSLYQLLDRQKIIIK